MYIVNNAGIDTIIKAADKTMVLKLISCQIDLSVGVATTYLLFIQGM